MKQLDPLTGQVVDDHLGGYVPNGDPATYYPELWDWLVFEFNVQSVIDVGCGDGPAVRYFEGLLGRGNVLGVDGIPQDHPAIVSHDYTKGRFEPLDWRDTDLCWCCEFVEHVEEQFIQNFLSTFKCAHTVLMTHAEPGQGGHHHVNCRPAEYWKGVMAVIGYRFDQGLTDRTRELAAANPSPWNHYKRSGMAFVRV